MLATGTPASAPSSPARAVIGIRVPTNRHNAECSTASTSSAWPIVPATPQNPCSSVA